VCENNPPARKDQSPSVACELRDFGTLAVHTERVTSIERPSRFRRMRLSRTDGRTDVFIEASIKVIARY